MMVCEAEGFLTVVMTKIFNKGTCSSSYKKSPRSAGALRL